jgi:ATP-dependent 26S proteasome regulatory subunit
MRGSWFKAIRKDEEVVTMEDFNGALRRVKPRIMPHRGKQI